MTEKEAIDLAWEMLGKDGPGTRNEKLDAAHTLQMRNLHLKPWQQAPCYLIDEDEDDLKEWDQQAYKILKRLEKANISPWHPNPLKALALHGK